MSSIRSLHVRLMLFIHDIHSLALSVLKVQQRKDVREKPGVVGKLNNPQSTCQYQINHHRIMSGSWSGGNWSFATTTSTTTGNLNTNSQKSSETSAIIDNAGWQLKFIFVKSFKIEIVSSQTDEFAHSFTV